ncbi:uncharacterized protein EAE98_005143 [Botrytis deweyae]|uniref:Ubiquitin 3 binding protein But2 C-terminal domain-containing protein n=1 Tax=Botrytis deweyae TaxID=2478750 RepID=A0ABQ7IN97_9HELO|nr:uncharacterized protein EAE98_005143 [Botrytis deweyae]KAF7929224.1 hypothetical protein EAE98_005143 [Botrytis deweyae]
MSRLNSITIFMISIFSLLASVMANSLEFFTQDTTERTVFFTPNTGSAEVPSLFLPAKPVDKYAIVVQFPQGWSGSFKAILPGETPNVPKVTGEITFQGFQGKSYYAVSAVDNCCDNSGIRYLVPKAHGDASGCIMAPFPCTESYSRPGDMQVKSTSDVSFLCVLGGA